MYKQGQSLNREVHLIKQSSRGLKTKEKSVHSQSQMNKKQNKEERNISFITVKKSPIKQNPHEKKKISRYGRSQKQAFQTERRTLTPDMSSRSPKNLSIFSTQFKELLKLQHDKECDPYCKCSLCRRLGYTRKVKNLNLDEIFWKGLLILNPNTLSYRISNCTLTYRKLGDISLVGQISQLKFYIDSQLQVPLIKITKQEGQHQHIILGNRIQVEQIYTKTLYAHLIAHAFRFWTPYRAYQSEIEGKIYKKYSFSNDWEMKRVRITKAGIEEDDILSLTQSTQFWTHLEIITSDLPHLIVKIRNGISKIEYAVPIPKLSQWIIGFLTLVKTT